MKGAAPYRKGAKAERDVVRMLTDMGLDASRIPLSGAMAGWPGDLRVTLGRPHVGEVKTAAFRSCKWKTILNWLVDRDLLFLVTGQSSPGEPKPEPVVCLRLSTLDALLRDEFRATKKRNAPAGDKPTRAPQGSRSSEPTAQPDPPQNRPRTVKAKATMRKRNGTGSRTKETVLA